MLERHCEGGQSPQLAQCSCLDENRHLLKWLEPQVSTVFRAARPKGRIDHMGEVIDQLGKDDP